MTAFVASDRDAIKITQSILKDTPTIKSALVKLEGYNILSLEEIEKVRLFAKSQNAIAAPINLRTNSNGETFKSGSLNLKLKPNGDLATVDGLLLGINDDSTFAEQFESSYKKLTEKPSFSNFDFFLKNFLVENAVAETSMSDSAGGALAAAMYKLTRKFLTLMAHSNAETICLTGLRPFSQATWMDEYRKEKFGEKAGIFECDKNAPLGVRRFLPNLKETSKRARETKHKATDYLRKIKKETETLQGKERVESCIAKLRPEQDKMIEQASEVFWTQDEVANAVNDYEASSGEKFVCSQESLKKMADQQKWKEQAGLTFIMIGAETGALCGRLRTSGLSAGCGSRILDESIRFTDDTGTLSNRAKSEKVRK